MSVEPVITILVSTRNRAHAIADTVDALVKASRWTSFSTEILFVDNGSTDSTPEVLSDLAQKYPELRVVRDDIAGKSGACNRALRLARGDAVIFTDDDVRVPESWVGDMAGPILRGEADAVAGPLQLAGYLDRPWFTPRLRVAFAEILDVGGPLPGMVGASMAASRKAAMAIGFDEEMGPGALGCTEDVLFNLRLKAAGYRLIGSSGPPAIHYVDEDRLEYERLVDFAYRNGRSTAYLWHHWLHTDLRFVRLRLLRNALGLRVYRALHRRRLDQIDEREFDLVEKASFCRQLTIERKRRPNYTTPHKHDNMESRLPGLKAE